MKELHRKFMQTVDSLIKKKLKKEPIIAIILGGSVARGDETEHSDIDIVFYVNRKDLPKDLWRFYKFRGKYIEEHYSSIEELKMDNILSEEKILYDKTGKLVKIGFNETKLRKQFCDRLKEAKKYQKLAEDAFKKRDYEKSFYHLYGLGSPAFIIMHSLPPRYNLPFPSFRLLKSIKLIDLKNKTYLYEKIRQIYTFNNKNNEEIVNNFKKAYMLMNRIKRKKNPKSKNLGFLDKTKIEYNIEELRRTFEDYPFVYAYRFIVGCLVMWVFDKNNELNDKKRFYRYLLNSLGIENIDENLVKQKIRLTGELIKECEKVK